MNYFKLVRNSATLLAPFLLIYPAIGAKTLDESIANVSTFSIITYIVLTTVIAGFAFASKYTDKEYDGPLFDELLSSLSWLSTLSCSTTAFLVFVMAYNPLDLTKWGLHYGFNIIATLSVPSIIAGISFLCIRKWQKPSYDAYLAEVQKEKDKQRKQELSQLILDYLPELQQQEKCPDIERNLTLHTLSQLNLEELEYIFNSLGEAIEETKRRNKAKLALADANEQLHLHITNVQEALL